MSNIPASTERLIASIRIAHLAVQAEAARRSELANRPFVVMSGASANAGIVMECSPRARDAGVREGMAVREVPAVCKEAVLLPPDPDYYHALHMRMLDALECWVPIIEEGELGCAYTDLSGMGRLYPRAEALLTQLQRAAAAATGDLRAGAGAGPNKFVAAMAAHVAGGETKRVAAAEVASFLAPFPLHHLALSRETQRRLTLLGLQNLGEIACMHPDALTAQFGHEGRRAWELARGIDPSPVIPRRPFRPIMETLLFPAPVSLWSSFWAGLAHLLVRLWRRKERGQRTVRQIELAARTSEERWEKSLTFNEPVGDCTRLEAMVKRRLDGSVLPGAVLSLTAKVTLLGGAYVGQESLFVERAHRMNQIKESLARLKAQYGTTGLYRVAEVEPWSRIPERRYGLISFDP